MSGRHLKGLLGVQTPSAVIPRHQKYMVLVKHAICHSNEYVGVMLLGHSSAFLAHRMQYLGQDSVAMSLRN